MKSDLYVLQAASPSRRKWLYAAAAAGAALAGAGLALWRYRLAEPEDGALAALWALEAELPGGSVFKMARLRGKPLVVNFWATWCPPCVEELPMIEAFWREHGPKGLQVLALAIDQPSAVRRFLERQPLAFPVGLAGLTGSQLARNLGNVQGGLPFSVFFRPDQSIYKQKIGQLTPDDLQNWLREGV